MDNLQKLSAKLETWLWELPDSMRLGSLAPTDAASLNATKRPVLFLHIIHVTSQVLLYERVMLAILKQSMRPSDELVVREVFRLPAETQQVYESFAQQLARMIRLLQEEDCILAKCWVTMYVCPLSFNADLQVMHATIPASCS